MSGISGIKGMNSRQLKKSLFSKENKEKKQAFGVNKKPPNLIRN